MSPLQTILVIAMAVMIVPSYCLRYGERAILEDVGLKPQLIQTSFVQIENVEGPFRNTRDKRDVARREEEEKEEKEEKEETVSNPLIANGESALPGMFPFQAALLINTSVGFFQICGAVLLSERRALTAAQCLKIYFGDTYYDHFIAVGIHDRTLGLLNPGSQMVKISRADMHRRYTGEKEGGYTADIAMLYLEEDVEENAFVRFAKLAEPGDYLFSLCRVSGWGKTEDGPAEVLQFGSHRLQRLRTCQDRWAVAGGDELIADKHICSLEYPVSPCVGDAGGPLTCGSVVAGIMSWGLASCSGCFPYVHTRISSYHSWITKRMGNVQSEE